MYDMNCRLYDKSRTALSMELLAKILGCSRNQLNYRQQQIDDAYRLKLLELAGNLPKHLAELFEQSKILN